MKILTLTQSEPRDEQIDKILNRHLAEMGHTTAATNFVLNGRKGVTKLKPDAVILPEARCEYSRDFCETLNRMGILVIIRRTEPGFSKDDTRSDIHKQFCIGKWKYKAELEITFGEEFADILKENSQVLGKNIAACGGFNFDPYYPLPKREKQKRKVVCFATIWDYADRDPQYCVPELPYGHPLHAENYWACRKGRDMWLAEIVRVRRAYPNWHIVVKIHPAEHPTEYLEKLKDIPGLQVVNAPTAIEVLTKTDLLVHAGSTMAIEAHLMGIPAIQFGQLEDTLVSNISPRVDSVELDKVDLSKSNADINVIKELERTFYGKIDGKACFRAAQEINKLKPKKTNIPDRWPQSERGYETPGISKTLDYRMGITDMVQCVGCKNMAFIRPWQKLLKCPHCALALCR